MNPEEIAKLKSWEEQLFNKYPTVGSYNPELDSLEGHKNLDSNTSAVALDIHTRSDAEDITSTRVTSESLSRSHGDKDSSDLESTSLGVWGTASDVEVFATLRKLKDQF